MHQISNYKKGTNECKLEKIEMEMKKMKMEKSTRF